ncbi:DUF3426 domain-containing protein [Bermanella marisrubri]|uniref:MJ0042 family finger-like domain protein n=1 Tax=Bermanella marisrubri TaxID=207949 RepID=Q1N3K0_9GAMM|nr:DUF3426 domain-containing protein [Bermanella marisrubri]EAT12874.1 MJ0042 family finger-like domain protein [Oceanobacter sp. RED65] [Bermanella marisrubri]QIZ83194.1 DUF3426 domain-containing protein [Bermanella marisrubri]
MTNQAHITKCPKCDTTFRVTDAQLKVAKGAVRCGACLQVFRASDHFQEEKPSDTPVSKDDRTQDMFAEESENHPSASENKSSNHLLDSDDDIVFADDPDEDLIDDGDVLIQDEEKGLEISEDFLSLNPEEIEDPFFSDSDKLKESVKDDSDTSNDESWAEALLDDSDSDANDFAMPVSQTPKQLKQNAPDPVAKQNFAYIDNDPIDLSLPQKTSKARLIALFSGCIVLTLVLIGQVFFFNFDSWSRQAEYRPLYQQSCQVLGCELPSTYDLKKIRTTTSPQVSSHSDYQNALVVDILFMNHADYPQAFPKVELSFTDKNGKVMAQRLFLPSEYLAGEAAGLDRMPSNTPVHIALDIQDPGPQASSYRVRFVAP